jgi:HK97 gp10 family phage protein
VAEFETKLEGLDAIVKKMRALPIAVRQKGARFAGRRAANVIRDAVVENASRVNDPATREEIAKNVAVRFSSRESRSTGDVVFRVGILGGARQYANTRENRRKRRAGETYSTDGSSSNPGGDTFYWRFLEFGTQKAAAQPFMRPAAEQSAQPATTEFTTQLNAWLDRYFTRSGVVPPDL